MRVADGEPGQRARLSAGVLCRRSSRPRHKRPAYGYSINWRAIGRKSLEATKLLCSLMVRAAVDFLRGRMCLVGRRLCLALLDVRRRSFLLARVKPRWLASCGAGDASWAGNPLPCSNQQAGQTGGGNTAQELTGFSLTRLDAVLICDIALLDSGSCNSNPMCHVVRD